MQFLSYNEFLMINLKDIHSHGSLEESLAASIAEKVVEGDQHILLQSSIETLPEVCCFQLKRFYFDKQRYSIRKVQFF